MKRSEHSLVIQRWNSLFKNSPTKKYMQKIIQTSAKKDLPKNSSVKNPFSLNETLQKELLHLKANILYMNYETSEAAIDGFSKE